MIYVFNYIIKTVDAFYIEDILIYDAEEQLHVILI